MAYFYRADSYLGFVSRQDSEERHPQDIDLQKKISNHGILRANLNDSYAARDCSLADTYIGVLQQGLYLRAGLRVDGAIGLVVVV
mmetsp:Transcript_25471/g.84424  ORF Transcript_25471/g.84424 Transcript_25471/m.84424 type:complete len:85 (-) Transcript_25471:1462-1716(-)